MRSGKGFLVGFLVVGLLSTDAYSGPPAKAVRSLKRIPAVENAARDMMPAFLGRIDRAPCYRYAYVSTRQADGGIGRADNIFAADTCGGEVRQLTPNLSPDNLYGALRMSRETAIIAFAESVMGVFEDGVRGVTAVWQEFVDASRGGMSLLNTDSTYDGQPDFYVKQIAWGPRNRIAFLRTDLDHRNAFIVANDSSPFLPERNRTVYHPDRHMIIAGLDWAMTSGGDGKLILSEGPYATPKQLYVVDEATGTKRPLQERSDDRTAGVAMTGESPAVGKDGKLAFIRVDGDNVETLWTCDLDFSQATGDPPAFFCDHVLKIGEEGSYDTPCWSHDGKMVFASYNPTSNPPSATGWDIFMIDPVTSRRRRLTTYTGEDRQPACFPILYEAAPNLQYAAPPPIEEPAQYEPAQGIIYEAIPIVTPCKGDDDCPEGQACRDGACRETE